MRCETFLTFIHGTNEQWQLAFRGKTSPQFCLSSWYQLARGQTAVSFSHSRLKYFPKYIFKGKLTQKKPITRGKPFYSMHLGLRFLIESQEMWFTCNSWIFPIFSPKMILAWEVFPPTSLRWAHCFLSLKSAPGCDFCEAISSIKHERVLVKSSMGWDWRAYLLPY